MYTSREKGESGMDLITPWKEQFFDPLTLNVQKEEMLSKNLDSKLTLIYSNEKPNSERVNVYILN